MKAQTLILQTQPQPQPPNFEASVTIPAVLAVVCIFGLIALVIWGAG
jgi:hypothetical protein